MDELKQKKSRKQTKNLFRKGHVSQNPIIWTIPEKQNYDVKETFKQ